MAADRVGERLRVDDLLALKRRLDDLQIAPRQQPARIGDVAGVAAELHAVGRSAQRGGADAFAGRQQRPGQRAGIDAPAYGVAEPASHVAEIARLAPIDEFADAAGEHHAVDGPVRRADR